MQVQHCEFPEDLYYSVNNDTWVRPAADGSARVGVTTVLSFLAGKFRKLGFKSQLKEIQFGQTIATIESAKYFGAIKSPISGQFAAFNEQLNQQPFLANKAPYETGWIAQLSSFNAEDLVQLLKGEAARAALSDRIKELKIRCFKALPDEEMFSIGTECSTTLANLNELLVDKPGGTVVHLVTDDPTAEIEMIRWSDQTKNLLLETRKEDNLSHFLVEKSAKNADHYS